MDSITLEDILAQMITKFEKSASIDGDSETLSQDELRNLAIKEFPTLNSDPNKDEILKAIFEKMDCNQDKKVDFEEFMEFFSNLAVSLRKLIKKP